MLANIRAHVERKIAGATLESSPFPHLVISDFFPDDVYQRIIQFNPFQRNVGVQWLSREYSAEVSSATPYYARKQINFHADQEFDAPEDQREFWSTIRNIFLDDEWFPYLIIKKTPDIFSLRFGDLVNDPDFVSLFRRELFLQRHEQGYYIGPHTDIPTRVFTCIFSFASEEGWDEYGTELLAPKDRLVRCWGNDHYGPEGFEVRKVAPYRPNSFLLFFKTRQSFHSVRTITPEVPNQRYGMQFQFYEPWGGLFKDLSSPALMDVIRPPRPVIV
ncbi:2OG-Fe(II) oxygenase [Sphingomonas sp. AP4-R1]|uniref:2OG-Fe(II) oxygenase n=1 Tax=Sphingomonas sp. AP4-R1 TaxID=2735134 RepID=UPI001493C058|nr:2OG-Fe(II) oxygenase [Sphingomonas sp. AP4-R1]QJU57616.1 2OG-Fe(II) oxygenase [Sphingomonas sp. AP4-R1]